MTLAVWDRPGPSAPLLYLPGLGSPKEDFAHAARDPRLGRHRLMAIDWPGCGASPYPEAPLAVDDLVAILDEFIELQAIERPILIGHSLGGIVALLYASAAPVRGFINVEGNLAAEDCIFSRQAASRPAGDFTNGSFFRDFEHWLRSTGRSGFDEYADGLRRNADPRAFRDYSPSIVSYSDSRSLLKRFLALKAPRAFVHGSENDHLSYLPELRSAGIPVHSISGSNHFPATSNPREFLDVVASFVKPPIE